MDHRPRGVTWPHTCKGETAWRTSSASLASDTKDQSCVRPARDCIHPGSAAGDSEAQAQLYIDLDTCIDCGACEPVCPVTAIFAESDVPGEWQDYIQKNADYFKK